MVFAAPPRLTEPDDERALVEQAAGLRRAVAEGRSLCPLRGRNLGLLCPDAGTPSARLFCQAAGALGARVAHIPADTFASGGDVDLASSARMLGRLYDVVECQGLAPGVAQQLAALAGNVVCDGLAADDVLIDRLAQRLDGTDALADKRRFVLQALLLRRLS